LRNRIIDRPNKVWALDIAYLQMKRGFTYFIAVMDWATRRVLSWRRLANTMTADFCVEVLQEALARCAGDCRHGSRQPVHKLGVR